MAPRLSYLRERVFLEELRVTCDSMVHHTGKYRAAHEEWLALQGARMGTDGVSPDSRADALQSIELQRCIWRSLEAFLTGWARTSLILFPATLAWKKEAHARAAERSSQLRSVLALPDDSRLGDRTLRNAWMHFDDRLDEALLDDVAASLQLFTESQLAPPRHHLERIMRVLIVDQSRIVFRGEEFTLDELFQEVRTLMAAVGHAQATLEARHGRASCARAVDGFRAHAGGVTFHAATSETTFSDPVPYLVPKAPRVADSDVGRRA